MSTTKQGVPRPKPKDQRTKSIFIWSSGFEMNKGQSPKSEDRSLKTKVRRPNPADQSPMTKARKPKPKDRNLYLHIWALGFVLRALDIYGLKTN